MDWGNFRRIYISSDFYYFLFQNNERNSHLDNEDLRYHDCIQHMVSKWTVLRAQLFAVYETLRLYFFFFYRIFWAWFPAQKLVFLDILRISCNRNSGCPWVEVFLRSWNDSFDSVQLYSPVLLSQHPVWLIESLRQLCTTTQIPGWTNWKISSTSSGNPWVLLKSWVLKY